MTCIVILHVLPQLRILSRIWQNFEKKRNVRGSSRFILETPKLYYVIYEQPLSAISYSVKSPKFFTWAGREDSFVNAHAETNTSGRTVKKEMLEKKFFGVLTHHQFRFFFFRILEYWSFEWIMRIYCTWVNQHDDHHHHLKYTLSF